MTEAGGAEGRPTGNEGAAGAPPLPPFAPPASYRLEPELAEIPPRPIPARIRAGRYATRQRTAAAALFVFGALFLLLGSSPVLDRLAYYILPLRYLGWIGGALLAGAVAIYASAALGAGRYRYVRAGVPGVARVRSLAVVPRSAGHATFYELAAGIEMRHPDTSEIATFAAKSWKAFTSAEAASRARLRVGDYVTAVHLPGKFPKSLTLYGFLELDDEASLFEPPPRRSPAAVFTIVSVGVLVFAALIGTLYAIEFYWPIDPSGSFFLATGLGGAAVGAPLGLAMRSALRKEAAKDGAPPGRPRPRAQVAILAIFVLILGCGVAASGSSVANALLDRSEPEFAFVKIKEFWQTTHDFIIRDYSIEYEDMAAPGQGTEKIATTVEQMKRFTTRAGALEIHGGRFGWRWVKQIHPVLRIGHAPDGTLMGEIELEDGEKRVVGRR